MYVGKRLTLLGGLFASLLMCTVGYQLGLVPFFEEHRQSTARWFQQLEANWHMQAKLEQESQIIVERIETKNRVIHELLAGRLNLLEAIQRFDQLNHQPDRCPARSVKNGTCTNAFVCRQVICWAVSQLRQKEGKQKARALKQKLEQELDSLRGPDGTLSLLKHQQPGTDQLALAH